MEAARCRAEQEAREAQIKRKYEAELAAARTASEDERKRAVARELSEIESSLARWRTWAPRECASLALTDPPRPREPPRRDLTVMVYDPELRREIDPIVARTREAEAGKQRRFELELAAYKDLLKTGDKAITQDIRRILLCVRNTNPADTFEYTDSGGSGMGCTVETCGTTLLKITLGPTLLAHLPPMVLPAARVTPEWLGLTSNQTRFPHTVWVQLNEVPGWYDTAEKNNELAADCVWTRVNRKDRTNALTLLHAETAILAHIFEFMDADKDGPWSSLDRYARRHRGAGH